MLRAAPPVLAFALSVLAIGGCDRGQSSDTQEQTCPPCACACAGTETGALAADGTDDDAPEAETGDADNYEVSEVIAAANRKMMHGDGQGCLAEIEQALALAPKLETSLIVTRAQCQMLVGKCQEGKELIVEFYMREMAMGKELAEKTAENIASMRCKGGNSTARDKLLAAYHDLQDGAYMNKRSVDYCKDKVAAIEALAPKVKPRDAEDSMITGGRQALFHTSAMCLARAGDCDLAYQYYKRLFPPDAVAAIPDPQMLETTVRDSFNSSIVLCEGKGPAPSP